MTTKPRTKLPTEILTINEIAERFPDQWILLRVTESDQWGRSVAGQIVAVGKHSRVPWTKLIKIHTQHAEDRSHYFVFNAFPRIDSGEHFKEILDNVDLSRLPRGIL